MKAANSKAASGKLAGVVQMAGLRVAAAEHRRQVAREQARVAKRRCKEVKLIARRAKKQAKQAKADLAEARKVLAEAEAKLARSAARPATSKSASARRRPVKKVAVGAPGGKVGPARKRRPRPTAPNPVTVTEVQGQPESVPAQPGTDELASAETK